MSPAPTLDPERQTKAKAYARLRRRLFFVNLGLSGMVTLAWLIFGWPAALKGGLLTFTRNDWLLVAAFGAIFYLSFAVLELPLEYYSGFVLPHRYDQSTETLGGWAKDQLLGLLLTAVIGLPVLEGVYWLLRVTGPLWWMWAAAGYVLLAVSLSSLAPVIILPLFNKYAPLGEEHAELAARLTALAGRAGTKVNGVFRFDMSKRTKAANAALTGLGNTRRIILGDTLLDEFTTDEVETVIAHELGHHVHRDIPMGIFLSAVVALASLYLASLALNRGAAAFDFSGPADIAALPLFALTLGLFGLITLPLNNAFSRWREVRADRYALEATRNPQAFANAMTRLANQNLAEADPEPWVVFLLYSHPPIRDRVAMAAKFQTQ
ncbi:MAG: Ste24 endopeptidase [Anaerolineales bacterium]|nr:Ste24 endopeptidase [Anaerolineales bacterium]